MHRKGLSEYVAVAVVGAMLSIGLFVYMAKDAVDAVSSWQDLDVKQAAVSIRSAMQFLDKNVTGVKFINISDSTSVKIDETEIQVICSEANCDENYMAYVPHGIPDPEKNLRLQNPEKTGAICVVKREFSGEIRIAICSVDEKLSDDELCCTLGG